PAPHTTTCRTWFNLVPGSARAYGSPFGRQEPSRQIRTPSRSAARRSRSSAVAIEATAEDAVTTPPAIPVSSSGRLLRQQVLELGHDLAGEQLHRVAPRLGILRIVEAEQQERAEAAHLVVDGLQPLGDRRRRPDHPVVTSAVLGGNVRV